MTARREAGTAAFPIGGSLTGASSTPWWAMVILIANEGIFFASLLASYFYLRVNAVLWPPQGVQRPELGVSSINTAILLASSLALQWGSAGIARGRAGRLRIGLALAFVLGTTFLGIQIYEYTQLKFMPQDHAYGSLVWGIPGGHAMHVLVGLLLIAYVEFRAFHGHFAADRRQAVENAALYWHFIDVVWLCIFASLFLSPYW